MRAPALGDAASILAAYAQDPEVTRYLEWRPHRHIADTESFLHRCVRAWDDAAAFPWVLIRKDTRELIGMAEIRVRAHMVDMGYVLARSHWHNGYMCEALTPVIAWAFAQPSIQRVWATCDVDNLASARVLERLGLKLEGVLRRWIVHPAVSDQPRDSLCYSRIRGD